MVAPAAAIVLICYYSAILWTFVVSFTGSRLLPNYDFVGWTQYRHLFSSGRWWQATENLVVFSGLFVFASIVLGYGLAILVHKGVRHQAAYLTVFLMPLSLSFVETGIVWQWIFNPDLGLERAVRNVGWDGFSFAWTADPDLALYTLVVAAVWQHAGLCLLVFLGALRSINPDIWKAARIEGISSLRTYFYIVTPQLRPAFYTVAVLLSCIAVKSYDLVVTLTDGGPGFSSDLPARFVMQHIFERQELGLGAAGAFMMLCMAAVVIVPYLMLEKRRQPG